MIFVTLGTQKEPFTRLLDYIENSNIKQRIIVQAGYTRYESERMEIAKFFSPEEVEDLIKKSRLVITHGGTGSILTSLRHNKKTIACARLKKYGEHVDDHQREIVETFRREGYILEVNENNSLDSVIANLNKFKPKEYVSNTPDFIRRLKKEIG